jgi:beta-aspartyl-peptidase (threonine type)
LASIIVHGGAGNYKPDDTHERGVKRAVEAGWSVLKDGGSALDAVESAIVVMEDDPTFRAGYGSPLNLAGDIETDASVMLGDRSCGAVGALRAATNPIRAARLVMERTDHVMLVGAGADDFVRRMGLPESDLRCPKQLKIHDELKSRLAAGGEIDYMPRLPVLSGDLDLGTVGAAAVDDNGLVAAGTSTGGMTMKLPGRIGDSAVIGAGTYAAPSGGVSATGHGEPIMRLVLAKVAVDAMEVVGVREAMEVALEMGRGHGVRFGLVGVEENGAVGYGFTTKAMAWASFRDGVLSTFREDG